MNSDGADASNLADALVANAPAAQVVLALATAAVRARGLDDFGTAELGERDLVREISLVLAHTDPALLLSLAAALDGIGEEVAARGFVLAAGGALGGHPGLENREA